MTYRRLALLLVLGWLTPAQANDIVCGNGVRPTCAGTTGLTTYLHSQEPSAVQPGCFVVPDSQATTSAQRTLMQSNATHPGALLPKQFPCYLKVEDGLGVEMTLAEKQAVDTAIQAQRTAHLALTAEADDAECRNVTLAQLTAKFDTLRTTIQNDLASSAMNTPATIRQGVGAALTRVVNALEKLAKCERAKGR